MGDGLTLVGALGYAMHITATGFFAPKVRPATLAVTQIAVSLALCLVITPFVTHVTLDLPLKAWAAIAWTGFSGTVLAFLIQSWAQRRTTSTHAAVLLCLESVFSATFGVIFGMDSVTWRLLTRRPTPSGTMIIELLPGGARPERAPAQALLPVEALEGRGRRGLIAPVAPVRISVADSRTRVNVTVSPWAPQCVTRSRSVASSYR